MSLPPRPPNEHPRVKEATRDVQDVQDVLDDTTLMTVVTALYAFFLWMSFYGLEPCTC